jgi:hypothetical protein
MKMKKNLLLFKEIHSFIATLSLSVGVKRVRLAADLRNVLESFRAEILNDLNVLKECLLLNYTPTKFKELLAEKRDKDYV